MPSSWVLIIPLRRQRSKTPPPCRPSFLHPILHRHVDLSSRRHQHLLPPKMRTQPTRVHLHVSYSLQPPPSATPPFPTIIFVCFYLVHHSRHLSHRPPSSQRRT